MKEKDEEKLVEEAGINAFRELKQYIRLEKDHTPQTTPNLQEDATRSKRPSNVRSVMTGQSNGSPVMFQKWNVPGGRMNIRY